MGRKYELQKHCKKLLANPRRGSFQTRKEHQREMNRFLDDCAHLKQLPPTIKHIEPYHIERLVAYWRKKNLLDSTIMTKLAVLRRLNRIHNLGLTIPTNSDLALEKSQPNELKIDLPRNYDKKIYHPITSSMIDLQCHFGLTISESAKIRPFALHRTKVKELTIYRPIAHNNKDRWVPVLTPEQQKCIEERQNVINHCPFFKSERLDFTAIMALYKAECRYAGFSHQTPFRKLYAQQRLQVLKQSLSDKQAWRELSKEMGYQRPDTLKKKLL